MRRRAFLKNALLATASAGLGFHPAAAQTLPQGDLITGATPIPDNPFMPSIDGLRTITVGDRLARERRDATVAVVTFADPMEAGYEILRLQNPALRADRALLKVNMSTSTSANWRTLTAKDRPRLYATGSDPRFIEGMMQYLQERGIAYDRVTIAEAVGGSDYTMDRFAQMGFTELAAKTGAALVDLNTTEPVGVLIPQSTLMPHVAIAKPVMDHYEDGVLINVPKMKNHRLPVVTLGAKNMMGAILPPNAKRLCHPEFERAAVPGRPSHFYRGAYYEALMYFGARLADLYLITPDLVVIDGVIAGEGSGFLVPETDETRPWEPSSRTGPPHRR